MTKGRNSALVLWLAIVLLLASVAFAQETTGTLQGTVKDAQGAVVTKAAVEVSSPNLLGAKTTQTDSAGGYRISGLPPGQYTLTVSAAGFATSKQTGIVVEVGKSPTVDVSLKVGGHDQVIEVTGVAPLVDTTTSKVQTNITETLLAEVPTGRSFQSVIQFAPGARTEPLQSTNLSNNGFQIDGASNSENAYLVEGQETAALSDGHSAANVPMEFIQEVQVKSSGFEAEYGGALGGVVNVIMKRGGPEWHGKVFTYYAADYFDGDPNKQLRKDPTVGANNGGAVRLDQPSQIYTPKKDHYTTLIPGFAVGGPIFKDKLAFFGSFAPNLFTFTRNVNFKSGGLTAIRQEDNTYYANGRLDYTATSKIRLYGAMTYQYERVNGFALPNPDDQSGLINTSSTNAPTAYGLAGLGYVYPNVIYGAGADITLTPNLVATTRFGYFMQDTQSRGTPIGIRYFNRDTNYPYTAAVGPAIASVKALDGTSLPAADAVGAGYYNMADNTGTVFDKWKRYSFNQDLAWFKRGWGVHNFKFGYAMNKGSNDVLTGYNSADVYFSYNQPYGITTTNGITNCLAINAQNMTNYGTIGGGAADGTACQGNWGTVNLRELGTTGKVGGINHSFYVQDGWTVNNRLTVNVGLRLDKENLPSYMPGFKGVSFGWGQKMAPRLGASYDVLGNGKLKAYASFGYFFDIMKYNLPRGSFGGDYWHDCVYALDTPTFTSIIPTRDSSGHYCPTGGGNVPANGTLAGLRFIENTDYRQPSNDPNVVGTLGPTGLVDPNLKPMKQHEMVIGTDYALAQSLALEVRYSRKRLDRTIEDTGIITPNGEQYYISNPGEGVNATVPTVVCTGCPANPKAVRNYDGIEFRLTKRATASQPYGGGVSYTYSRLYGNYSGLTATDVSDGGAGRNGANTDRAFDESFMQFDAHGKIINGPLATDRPNTIKAYGFVNVKWLHQESQFGFYQQLYSGTPLSSYESVWGAPVFVEGRGKFINVTRDPTTGNWIGGSVSSKRTPAYSQTDFHFNQDFGLSKKNEALKLAFEANILNLFDQRNAILINQNLIRTSGINPASANNPAGFDYNVLERTGYDYLAQSNSQNRILNSLYGQAYGWQQGRTVRLQVAVHF